MHRKILRVPKGERVRSCPQCLTSYPCCHTTCQTGCLQLRQAVTKNAAVWMLALLIGAASLPALSQQDNGPILRPRVQPSRPSVATLLVLCDLPCNWRLDGEARGRIEGGGSAKAKVELGQHFVVATTEDGVDQVKLFSEVKSTGQTIVNLELMPVRSARLKAEKDARDKAELEAKANAEREAREKAEQEARVRAASEQIERELQQQRNRATDLVGRGYAL